MPTDNPTGEFITSVRSLIEQLGEQRDTAVAIARQLAERNEELHRRVAMLEESLGITEERV